MRIAIDVTYREDSSTKRQDHAPRKFSTIRKFAYRSYETR